MRLVRAVAALSALALLFVGVPWLLIAIGNPGHLLQVDWSTALLVGADSRVVLALVSVVAWLAWGILALTVLFEAVAVLTRERVVLRLPGTAWLRPAAAALVVAAFSVQGPSHAAATAGAPEAPPALASTADGARQAEVGEQEARARPVGRSYIVQSGDELWSVAERELGSGERWRDIVALNPGISDTTRLIPGEEIVLPGEPHQPRVVTVQPGESLWSIAERELGEPERWPEVFELNRDQVDDPDQIDIGWQLEVPGGPDAGSVVDVEEIPGDGAAELPADDPAPPEPSVAPESQPEPEPARPSSVVVEPSAGIEAAVVDRLMGRAQEPVAQSAAEQGEAAPLSSGRSADEVTMLLGSIGALMAAGVVAGLATRRRAQLLGRAVGQRLVPVSPQVGRFWTALGRRAADDDAATAMTPTTLVLGWDADRPVHHDLELARATAVTGQSEPLLAAALTSLTCAPWSSSVSLIVSGDTDWAAALDDPRVEGEPDADAAIARLLRQSSQRRLAMRQERLSTLRADPDRAEAWSPVVYVFTDPLAPAQLDALGDVLALGEVGVSVLFATNERPHVPAVLIEVGPAGASMDGTVFDPQLVERPAKRALLELLTATGTPATEPAPWWRPDALPANVTPLDPPEPDQPEDTAMTASSPQHPTLLLLGEVDLVGAAGDPPSRARGQCMEYCAWILAHPGARATTMMQSLLVADSTRRSNMSRLRSWLGSDDDGVAYLPDAYSGLISLDSRVSSDWEQFEGLLSGGVNVASTESLRRALRMVRGEPLGSYGFQWIWAEQLRADMVAMIVDAACVLADRALTKGDVEGALWAVGRGRLAQADDALAVREIHALSLAGRQDEAERAVVALNRAARAAGRDLAPEHAQRVQAALRSARVG